MLCTLIKLHSIQRRRPAQKNHTPKPSYKSAENIIHIELQPMWQSGKLFIEQNFGDKKIFSCSFISGKAASCKIQKPREGLLYFNITFAFYYNYR
jgi:hypothetical protein